MEQTREPLIAICSAVGHYEVDAEELITAIKEIGGRPVLFSLDSRDTADYELARRITNQCDGLLLRQDICAAEIRDFVSRCDFAIFGRMHAVIHAMSQGVPFAALAYHPKFEFMLRDWPSDYFDMTRLMVTSRKNLLSACLAAWEAKSAIRQNLKSIDFRRTTMLQFSGLTRD